MLRSLVTITLFASFLAPGCDDPVDPDVARMAALCEALDDCDAAVDAYLDALEDEATAPAQGSDALAAERPCTHGCRPEPVRDFAAVSEAPESDGAAIDDLAYAGLHPDPDPLPTFVAP